MSYRAHSIASPNAIRYLGYGYGWRFSDARSVQAATSDRAHLGGKLMKYIVGLEPDESEALMAQLYEHCQCDAFVHKHKWRPGDVVFWDNRCTMHFAQAYDDKTFTRHMHRTTVQGDRPV